MKTYVCWLQRRQDKDNNKQLWVWIDTKGDERTLKFSTWLNSASQKIPYCWLLIWKSRCIAISFFLSTPLIHPEGKWYHLFMLPIDTHFLQLKMCVSKILFRAQLCITNNPRSISCQSWYFQAPPSFLFIASPSCFNWATRWRTARRTT